MFAPFPPFPCPLPPPPPPPAARRHTHGFTLIWLFRTLLFVRMTDVDRRQVHRFHPSRFGWQAREKWGSRENSDLHTTSNSIEDQTITVQRNNEAKWRGPRSYVLFNLRFLTNSINGGELTDDTYRLARKLFALDIIVLSFLRFSLLLCPCIISTYVRMYETRGESVNLFLLTEREKEKYYAKRYTCDPSWMRNCQQWLRLSSS